MSDTPDLANCATDTLLPTSPFYALNYHFGMLLGVEDFRTEQAYHRGKSRLHNAWLHREGVVWGLGVTLDLRRGEVRVGRGLALDPAGRELHLEEDACLSLSAWLAALPEDERVRLAGEEGTGRFDAHVLIRHRACLTRPVPALMEVCEGSGRDTAYSRVFETVEIRLLPGLSPPPPEPPYHRVRLILGLEPAREAGTAAAGEDAAILADRDDLLAKPREDRLAPALELLRDCAARDTAELAPAKTADGEEWLLFPGTEDAGILLADLKDLTLSPGASGPQIGADTVDYVHRPSHLATRTIQELAAAAFFCCPEPESVPEPEPTPEDGPRVLPDTVVFESNTIQLQLNADLHAASVKPDAFAVSAFAARGGWKLHEVEEATLGSPGPAKGLAKGPSRTVILKLAEPMKGDLYRLVARGTGPTPLLGTDLKPLAGAVGGPPAPEGCDFVWQQKGLRPPLRRGSGIDPVRPTGTDTANRPEES